MDKLFFEKVKRLLEAKETLYNNTGFIEKDPISIPHKFTLKQDIEIMGFFAAIFAWGQRATIINKCNELIDRFDNSPFEFIMSYSDNDLKQLMGFKHRTFNDTDLLYCVDFLRRHYLRFSTLEDAFVPDETRLQTVEQALIHFYNYFFDNSDAPQRTRKHISTPAKKSACKRINMYLRWMVRKDDKGVDFGIWQKLKAKDLICPLDLHVERTARILGLITRPKPDWMAAVELTNNLRLFDPNDPVKYDFALFGISIEEGVDGIIR
ncbi:TIGR02757 family protein [Dysgonomonas sp. 216]|uniref:TIGR02757 family protein n=1 Tax=Dysgonomonas sp. 216 TaxID=2302934 RepID=UPI0013CFF394|nr:TIGR02757 family protein [Dysgonomonas sp. 216]NDW19195.1 TIGR02757 family protein [Dysgonomonas sp. 216]